MYQGVLTRISNKGKSVLRGEQTRGKFSRLPTVGWRFVITGESEYTEGALRLVETSEVVDQGPPIDWADFTRERFTTESGSVYELDWTTCAED